MRSARGWTEVEEARLRDRSGVACPVRGAAEAEELRPSAVPPLDLAAVASSRRRQAAARVRSGGGRRQR